MVTFYDITDLVLARQKVEESERQALAMAQMLEISNKELTRTNVDLDNFVYTASHDLRSPVISLKALVQILKAELNGQLQEKNDKLLEMMDSAATQLLRVIDDLTQIAQVQKETDLEIEPISFLEMLQEVLTGLAELIRESAGRIHPHITIEHLVYARKNLRSILYNLLSNALKYRSPERKLEVQITFKMSPEGPVLVVADNGLGLGPDQLSKLFTAFKRFHSHVEGTGVGLYMVKRIVENNGGRMEVESQAGVGTTFSVYFGQASSK